MTPEDPDRVPAQPQAAPAPPRALATFAFIGINLAVSAAMTLSGANALFPDAATLLAWGAGYAPALMEGEWWRVITSAFVHVGLIHLLVNMWALRAVGPLIERLYGTGPYVLVYAASAAAGSLASALRTQASVSAGASGAIFGLFGALLAFLVARRHVLQPAALAHLRSSALMVVGINLAAGFAIPFIDNLAHIGGLAGGFLCGLAAWPRALPGRHVAASGVRASLAAVFVCAALAAAVAAVPHENPVKEGNAAVAAAWEDVTKEWPRLEDLQEELGRRQAAGAPRDELAGAFERDVLPGWEALASRFDQLPAWAREQDPELFELIALRRDVARALMAVLRTGEARDMERHNALYKDLQARMEAREKRRAGENAQEKTPR